jgi:hypothetical protein
MAAGVGIPSTSIPIYTQGTRHLVPGVPYLNTIILAHGVGGVNFDACTTVNGIPYVGELTEVVFPSTASSVQVSVQSATGPNPQILAVRILWSAPGHQGALATVADPIGTGAYVQLGETGSDPAGSVSFATAANRIWIQVLNTSGGTCPPGAPAAATEIVELLVIASLPEGATASNPIIAVPPFERTEQNGYTTDLFTFGAGTGIG